MEMGSSSRQSGGRKQRQRGGGKSGAMTMPSARADEETTKKKILLLSMQCIKMMGVKRSLPPRQKLRCRVCGMTTSKQERAGSEICYTAADSTAVWISCE